MSAMSVTQNGTPPPPASPRHSARISANTFQKLKAEIGKVVVGHTDVSRACAWPWLRRNRPLEGVPGALGNTLASSEPSPHRSLSLCYPHSNACSRLNLIPPTSIGTKQIFMEDPRHRPGRKFVVPMRGLDLRNRSSRRRVKPRQRPRPQPSPSSMPCRIAASRSPAEPNKLQPTPPVPGPRRATHEQEGTLPPPRSPPGPLHLQRHNRPATAQLTTCSDPRPHTATSNPEPARSWTARAINRNAAAGQEALVLAPHVNEYAARLVLHPPDGHNGPRRPIRPTSK